MAKQNKTPDGNGRKVDGSADGADHERLADAIEQAHDLPGFFPVVLIARSGIGFRGRLESELDRMQEGAPYRITRRLSAHGNYKAYRVELHVASGVVALARKALLAQLPGVILTL